MRYAVFASLDETEAEKVAVYLQGLRAASPPFLVPITKETGGMIHNVEALLSRAELHAPAAKVDILPMACPT